ncbi:MAG TPA: DUF4097 family beta strand repeat-containing protein [Thermoanaerobaculaceae bacterium]|nr:DUF4097 family beta strand repeat-containing protein [Thermoanaerobaculaceae bacterium]
MKLPAIAAVLVLLASVATAAEKTETIQKTFPSQPGKVVRVDVGALDIYVRASDIPDIRLKVELVAAAFSEKQATAWIQAHMPTIEDSEGELRITAPDPGGVSLFKGVLGTRAIVELAVPPNVYPDLSTSSGTLRAEGEFPDAKPMRLRSASGDIEFTGWAPKLEARSVSGDVRVLATKAIDSLLVRSASGPIELSGGARQVTCDNASGDVQLAGLLGPVVVNSTSGDVVARFDALTAGQEARITTSSGKVRLTLPPGTQPGGVLASTKGEIRSAYPGKTDPGTIRLDLSGKEPRVFVTTASGKIELN